MDQRKILLRLRESLGDEDRTFLDSYLRRHPKMKVLFGSGGGKVEGVKL